MAPPTPIPNPLLGRHALGQSASSLPSSPEGQAEVIENQRLVVDIGYQTALRNLEDGFAPNYLTFLQDQYRPYSNEWVEERLNEARQGMATGERRGYYRTLGMLHLMVTRQGLEEAPTHFREFTATLESYQNFLSASEEFDDFSRFRYLYAGVQLLHANLAWLGSQPPQGEDAQVIEEWRSALQGQLRRTYHELSRYYQNLSASGEGQNGAIRGLYLEIQMREALLNGEQVMAGEYATALNEYFQGHQPEEPGEWYDRWEQRILDIPDLDVNLDNIETPPHTHQSTIYLNALSFEFVTQVAATMDLIDEEEPDLIARRYRSLATIVTGLTITQAEDNLAEILQDLRSPGSTRQIIQDLEGLGSSNAGFYQLVQESLEALGIDNIEDLIHRAVTAANHLYGRGQGAGNSIITPLLRLNAHQNTSDRLSRALQRSPEIQVALGLNEDPDEAAQELLNRGEMGINQLQNYQDEDSEGSHESIISLLESSMDPMATINQYSHQAIAELSGMLSNAEDHEVAGILAISQLLASGEVLGEDVETSPEVINLANHLIEEIDSTSFKAGTIWRHLSSWESIATFTVGALASEAITANFIGRAGQSGSLVSRIGPLVRGGSPTIRASLVNGFSTGVVLSGVGSVLQNWQRSDLGFESNVGRDFLYGSLINSIALMGAFSVGYGLNRLWAPNPGAGYTMGRTFNGRSLAAMGLTTMTGGTLAWGAGSLLRAAHTGEFHATDEGWVESVLSMAAFELFGTGVRLAHRHLAMPGELGVTGFGRSVSANSRFARFSQALSRRFPVFGPYRAGQIRDAVGESLIFNPTLDGEQQNILAQLGLEEARYPETVQRYRNALIQGQFPLFLGSGRSRALALISPEGRAAESSASEIPITIPLPRDPLLSPADSAEPTTPVIPPTVPLEAEPPRSPLHSPADSVIPQETSPTGPVEINPLVIQENLGYILRQDFEPGLGPDPNRSSDHLIIIDPKGLEGLVGQEISLSRSNFSFLPPEIARVISRSENTRIRVLEDGEVQIEVTGESPSQTWVEGDQNWFRLEVDEPAILTPGTRIAFGEIYGPPPTPNHVHVTSADRWGGHRLSIVARQRANFDGAAVFTWGRMPVPEVQGPALFVRIDPGENQELGNLLLTRDPSGSMISVHGTPRTSIELVREFGPQAGEVQFLNPPEAPVLGEIGETVILRVHEGNETRSYRLYLNDSENSSELLPTVTMNFNDQSLQAQFRVSESALTMGRSQFLNRNYISKEHFRIRIVERQGEPCYELRVLSQMGLKIGDLFLQQSAIVFLEPGQHTLNFARSHHTVVGNDGFRTQQPNPDSAIIPMEITLPEIRFIPPEWGLTALPTYPEARPDARPAVRDDNTDPSTPIPNEPAETHPWYERMFNSIFNRD